MPPGLPPRRVQPVASTPMQYTIHDPFAVDADDKVRDYEMEGGYEFTSSPIAAPSREHSPRDDYTSGPSKLPPSPEYTTRDDYRSGSTLPRTREYGGRFASGIANMAPPRGVSGYTTRDSYTVGNPFAPTPVNMVPHGPPKKTTRNVIIFGESGSGKTSIINMLAGREIGAVSSGARGCTFESKSHQIDLEGQSFRLFDTSGLEEGEAGRVPKAEAIIQLHNLIMSLTDGVSLIVFCMRAPRIKDSAPKNWRLFYEVICQKKVPICIAITGLEQEEVMDDWWHRPDNKATFQNYDMKPSGFACLTATKGKLRPKTGTYQLQEEYDESKRKMEKLILNHYLVKAWSATPVEWVQEIVETTYGTDWCFNVVEHNETVKKDGKGLRDLIERCHYSEAEARALAEKLGNFM